MSKHSQPKLQTFGAIALCLALSGCAWWPGWKEEGSISISKKAADRAPLDLPDPRPIRPTAVEWIVVTPENVSKVWAELKKKNVDLVLFAVTDDGYEILATDMAQIRNFMAQQHEIIIKYREYYEPKRPEQK